MTSAPRLNDDAPLDAALDAALDGATSAHIAVAYAKSSGIGYLLGRRLPSRTRLLVGLGFGLTDPGAVERAHDAGIEVRAVDDSAALEASRFHPKIYMIERGDELVVLAGSANLTGGGLRHNVEQYEEMRLGRTSSGADSHRLRFSALWELGTPFQELRASGRWEVYRERARARGEIERTARQKVTRLHADTGQLLGRLARRSTRRNPGYLGITHPEWWSRQLVQRLTADRALFWRLNTNRFEALAPGGVFFHLVKAGSGIEEDRAVHGFSSYTGTFEVGSPTELWSRYGPLLGVDHPTELLERLGVGARRTLGVIHLDHLTELDRPVPLAQLRAEGIPFAKNIVSGKGLDLDSVAAILELGGLGVRDDPLASAAEDLGPFEAGA